MKSNRALVDSEYSWLGSIPAEWQVEPFRRVFQESPEINGSTPIGEMLSVSGYRGVEPKDYAHEELRRSDDMLEQYRVVRPGQLVVNTMWMNYSGLGFSEHLGHVSPAYRCYELTSAGYDPRFLHHLLRSKAYVQGYTAQLHGIRPNSLQLSRSKLMTTPVLRPPLHEQRAIADYIDRVTAKIDAVIEKQRALVDGLRLLRASTIEAAVTRGLGFRNSLRADDSEEEIQAPEGWSLIRADRALQRVKRGPRELDGVVTAFRDGQVTLRANRRTDGFTEALREIGYQGIRRGDLVIHAMDAFAGAIGVSDSDGKASPVVHAYRGKLADPHFMAYVLREASRAGFIQSLAKGIRERSTSFDPASLKKVYVFLPGMDEQREIAAHMDRETARIDALIARSERLIELSQERRSALITAAVTGQIDIAMDAQVAAA